MDDNFLVRLPSNVYSEGVFNNKTSNYTTKLAKRISFPLNEKYEVALTEISYPKTYFNVRHKFEIQLWNECIKFQSDLKSYNIGDDYQLKNVLPLISTVTLPAAFNELLPNFHINMCPRLEYEEIKEDRYPWYIQTSLPLLTVQIKIKIIAGNINGFKIWPWFNSKLMETNLRFLKIYREKYLEKNLTKKSFYDALEIPQNLSISMSIDDLDYNNGILYFYWIYHDLVSYEKFEDVLKDFQIGFWIEENPDNYSSKIIISAGNYSNQSFCDKINSEVKKYVDLNLNFKGDDEHSYPLINLEHNNKIIIFPSIKSGVIRTWIEFDNEVCDLLAIPIIIELRKYVKDYKLNLEEKKALIDVLLGNSESTSNFIDHNYIEGFGTIDLEGGFHLLYIYCDMVKPSFVGDSYSRLLRIVEVLKNVPFGDQCVIRYNNPQYIEVDQNDIENIKIVICDETGEDMSFRYGRVLLTLHFRKVKV